MSAIVRRARRPALRPWLAAVVFAAGTAAATLAATGTAEAQFAGRAPWCADLQVIGGTIECHYYSYRQCMERASGISNVCVTNPYFVEGRGNRVRGQRRGQRW